MNKSTFFFFFLFTFFSCTKVLHVAPPQHATISIEAASQIEPSEEITALIAPYKKEMEKEMNIVIGSCAKDLTKARPECTLGNWTADLVHKKCEEYAQQSIDFAIVNYGGMRIFTLPAGKITKSNVFELMPFENALVVIHVNAEILQEFFDKMALYGGWPVSHQVRYKIKNNKAIDITINGQPIDKNKIYKIALSDFIANGGDKCFFFKNQKRDLLGKLFRDAIMEHVMDLTKEGKKIDANIEGRVTVGD